MSTFASGYAARPAGGIYDLSSRYGGMFGEEGVYAPISVARPALQIRPRRPVVNPFAAQRRALAIAQASGGSLAPARALTFAPQGAVDYRIPEIRGRALGAMDFRPRERGFDFAMPRDNFGRRYQVL